MWKYNNGNIDTQECCKCQIAKVSKESLSHEQKEIIVSGLSTIQLKCLHAISSKLKTWESYK